MKKSLVIVFFALFYVNADASERKLDIKGFTMGMSEQQVIARFVKSPADVNTTKANRKAKPYRSTCKDSPVKQRTRSDKECNALIPIFNTYAFTKFLFFGDELGLVELKFRSLPSFKITHEIIYDAFHAKYGKPSIDNDDNAIWMGSGARIVLNKHLNVIGQIELSFFSDAFVNERTRRKNGITNKNTGKR